MKNIVLVVLTIFIFSCKTKPNLDLVVKKEEVIQQISDVFIGKKFYEADELNNYEYYSGGILSKDSLFNYSIYENEKIYIYSLEKQISYEDVKEFLILDTLKVYKSNTLKFETYSFPLKENKIISYSLKGIEKVVFVGNDLKSIHK